MSDGDERIFELRLSAVKIALMMAHFHNSISNPEELSQEGKRWLTRLYKEIAEQFAAQWADGKDTLSEHEIPYPEDEPP